VTSPSRRHIALFFAGVALLYLSLSPFSIAGQGYALEEMTACRQLLDGAPSVDWPRHGGVGLLFQCPFLAASRALPGSSAHREDRFLSTQPVLATAAIATILFVWCSRLSGSVLGGYALALLAGFATMLWPYAYIGLETTQALFLLLTGFLALGPPPARKWRHALALGACAAVAVTAKSNGVMLIPAVGYLLFAYRSRQPSGGAPAALAASLAAAALLGNSVLREAAWVRFGGSAAFLGPLLTDSVLSPPFNLLAFFGSPNKGLVVYAPLAVLGLLALPRAWAAERSVAIFAGLSIGGLALGFSLLEVWSDETWGPRYLHSGIGPLVLCLAAAWRGESLPLRRAAPLLAAAVLGFFVSLLGALFYYGALYGVATGTAPLTVRVLQGDFTWNHVRFNARLFDAWVRNLRGRATEPVHLSPPRSFDFSDPTSAPAWRAVDLRPRARPQPLLLRSPAVRARAACASFLLAGVLFTVSAGLWARRL
jgi:hypothetical protein